MFSNDPLSQELRNLCKERDLVEDKIQNYKWFLRFKHNDGLEEQKLSSELEELELQREHVRLLHQHTQRECHQKFHFVWGQLMKTGYKKFSLCTAGREICVPVHKSSDQLKLIFTGLVL